MVRLIDKADRTGRRYIFISKVRVRRLLHMIIRKQKFFSISREDIRALNSRAKRADAATTYITVWWRPGIHKLSIYNFRPNTRVSTDKIARLRRIVRKLETLLEKTKKKLG